MDIPPIPDGMNVCHACDNPACVNHEHLWLGDDVANMKDRDSKMRQAHGEAHYLSVLTEIQVLEMRSKYDAKPVHSIIKMLSKQYGISTNSIKLVLQGKTWKHLLPKE
jgi:hypothetical protein